jgi:hypothetical protein
MDSPGSDLSDYASDDFSEDIKGGRRRSMEPTPDTHDTHDRERPSKRLRLAHGAPSNSPGPLLATAATATATGDEELGELSEDSDTSVPASPNHHPGMSQDDDFGQEQVTVCKWEGCEAGDVDNMDRLVEHLHDDHIGTRQKKYSCEWSDCTRKGIPHASGYALRAHMRSHTREKPFYCTLPECDRSFTRSDALAKHMRTVHETEALRPSDPVPKHHSSNPSNKFQRLKLVLSHDARQKLPQDKDKPQSTPASPSSASLHPAPTAAQQDPDHAHNNITYVQDLALPGAPTMVQFPPDIALTPAELALPADQLFHTLRRALQYATDQGDALRLEADALEKQRKHEWDAKELLFENYMEFQMAKTRRDRLEQGLPDDVDGLDAADHDAAPSKLLDIHPKDGSLPWWRDQAWLARQTALRDTTQEQHAPRPAHDDTSAAAARTEGQAV